MSKRPLRNIRLGLSTLGSVLEELGELFNFFGFLDHAHGEHVRGCGFLDFLAQFAAKPVKPLDPFAEFLLVLLQQSSFCGGAGLRVRVNLCRVRDVRGPGETTRRQCARASSWVQRRLGRAASWEGTADPKCRFQFAGLPPWAEEACGSTTYSFSAKS